MSHPILVIAPSAAAQPAAHLLRRELDAAVETADNLRTGLARLRRGAYSLVLLDDLASTEPGALDLLYQNAGSAPIVEGSLKPPAAPRLLRQVRAALARRAKDHAQARASVSASLKNELGHSLAGLLLESELALRAARPEQAPKLRYLVELAGDLRDRLRVSA